MSPIEEKNWKEKRFEMPIQASPVDLEEIVEAIQIEDTTLRVMVEEIRLPCFKGG